MGLDLGLRLVSLCRLNVVKEFLANKLAHEYMTLTPYLDLHIYSYSPASDTRLSLSRKLTQG